MESLHGVLQGGLWIRFHGLMEILSNPPPRGGPDTNYGSPIDYFFQQDIFHDRFQDIFQDIQTPPSSVSQIGRVWDMLYQTKSSPLVPPTNYYWSWNMVHSHFTLCLRAFEYINMVVPTPMVRPLDEIQGSSTITRSRLLARVWSGP